MSSSDDDSTVIIIGGGAAGLSSAAALAKRGIHATILEKDDHIGGSWERRYQCLKLHTIRRFSGLAYYPIPKNLPRYLSKDEYAAYLRDYAQIHRLHISLGNQVNMVQENLDDPEGLRWEVVTSHGARKAKCIIIATGLNAEANTPRWEGMDGFSGEILHSSQYTNGIEYIRHKVLVVGLGNSGAEIAADLSIQGVNSISVSIRTVPPIVTREMFKILPVQVFGILLMHVGIPRVIDRISASLRRFSIGNLTPYGLGQAEWGSFTTRKAAVIDVGFVKQLKQGRIKIRPEIACFDSTGVIYTDGSKEAVDVVIAATGFRTGLEKIIKVPGVIDDIGQPRFRSGCPTSVPGLYFIGFNETVRGQLFEINRESKQLAVAVDHYLLRSN
jgi:cation diffusion facilitator CzcD-associated flavoprotein CzcO